MQPFRDIQAWQRSYKFALEINKVSSTFPSDERYGLTSQLRRAAVSVPNNIAEGSKRQGRQDFIRFLNIAEGSTAEMECLLMFVRDLGYLPRQQISVLMKEMDEVCRLLHSFRASVEKQKNQEE